MRVELLTIGSELTSGATLNTNAADLSRRLRDVGLPCLRQTVLGDEPIVVREALRESLERVELLITTGGLGPTFDDVTMAAIAEATRCPLSYRPAVAARIRRWVRRRHRALPRTALRQAWLPRGGVALPNPVGTAPGLWLTLGDRILVALPGVPRELRAMLERSVLPRLVQLPGRRAIHTVTLRTIGLVELHLERVLRRCRLPRTIQVGLYPHLDTVDLRLGATGFSLKASRRRLAGPVARLRRALGVAVYGTDEETLEGAVGKLLVWHHRTLAIAESCTGGLATSRITDVPGSSRYLRGSVIAYHNDLKRSLLMVPGVLLERYGAVSAPVATAMAEGIRRTAGADLGLSITGIAGPGGGTPQKPVGLVYIGFADGRTARVLERQFVGDRADIKVLAAQTALDFLRRRLL